MHAVGTVPVQAVHVWYMVSIGSFWARVSPAHSSNTDSSMYTMHARFPSKCCFVSTIHLAAGCFGQLFADADGHEMEGVVKVKLLFEGKPKI